MITDKQYNKALELIQARPDQAAFILAETQQRLADAETALHAIRSFSQNPALARHGDKASIEFAIGGRKL